MLQTHHVLPHLLLGVALTALLPLFGFLSLQSGIGSCGLLRRSLGLASVAGNLLGVLALLASHDDNNGSAMLGRSSGDGEVGAGSDRSRCARFSDRGCVGWLRRPIVVIPAQRGCNAVKCFRGMSGQLVVVGSRIGQPQRTWSEQGRPVNSWLAY